MQPRASAEISGQKPGLRRKDLRQFGQALPECRDIPGSRPKPDRAFLASQTAVIPVKRSPPSQAKARKGGLFKGLSGGQPPALLAPGDKPGLNPPPSTGQAGACPVPLSSRSGLNHLKFCAGGAPFPPPGSGTVGNELTVGETPGQPEGPALLFPARLSPGAMLRRQPWNQSNRVRAKPTGRKPCRFCEKKRAKKLGGI